MLRRNPQQQLRACYRLIAKMPTLAAMAYKTSIGQPIIYPRNDLNFSENFLHMMFAGAHTLQQRYGHACGKCGQISPSACACPWVAFGVLTEAHVMALAGILS